MYILHIYIYIIYIYHILEVHGPSGLDPPVSKVLVGTPVTATRNPGGSQALPGSLSGASGY